MQQKVVREIVFRNCSTSRNIASLIQAYVKYNPLIYNQAIHHPLLPIINLQQKLQTHLQKFDSLLVQYKLPPPILEAEPFQKKLLVLSSFSRFSSKPHQIETTFVAQKLSRAAERLNDAIRELNDHELEEKSIRSSIIDCRNDIQKCLKELHDQGVMGVQNQKLQKILNFIL